ncbi:MAG: HPr family phosphocarrier protein [Endomicrobiales bacterium]
MYNSIQEKVVVKHDSGLHLRVASDVVTICKKYQSTVTLSCKDCEEADACSIMSILLLGAHRGDLVTVTACGRDAHAAVEEISQYFMEGGGI